MLKTRMIKTTLKFIGFYLVCLSFSGFCSDGINFDEYKKNSLSHITLGDKSKELQQEISHIKDQFSKNLTSILAVLRKDIVTLTLTSLAEMVKQDIQRQTIIDWLFAVRGEKESIKDVFDQAGLMGGTDSLEQLILNPTRPFDPANNYHMQIQSVLKSCQERLLQENFLMGQIGMWRTGILFGVLGSGFESRTPTTSPKKGKDQFCTTFDLSRGLDLQGSSKLPVFVSGQNHGLLRILEYHPDLSRFAFIISSPYFLSSVIENTQNLLEQVSFEIPVLGLIQPYKDSAVQYSAIAAQINDQKQSVNRRLHALVSEFAQMTVPEEASIIC